ncbi:MAG TPA: DUF2510 domain-containing protein [Acidimicrobiales bacterium]|nr:DUF2510 domain-containing protein [Acidimicrobiales bacterium]
MDTEPAPQAPAGWYPDFWTPSRKRYWNGSSWTYATVPSAAVNDPPPESTSPLPEGHGLPAPVVRRHEAGADAGPPEKRKRPILWVYAVVVGVLVGLTGIYFSADRSSDDPPPAAAPAPTTLLPGPSTTVPLSAGNDPSASALESLVVTPNDVPPAAEVIVLPGGVGLNQPTLDLCNGRYPSESRRTARIQDAVLDAQGTLVFSTEAVLYGDSGGTTQAFAELQSVVANCPSTPVPGAPGERPVTTRFANPPDASWSQTAGVNRRAYDLTSDDGTGPRRTIAVYLQRGRVLLGVYFLRPDGAQVPVEGQTTIEGIVGVFAKRLAALPTSVVGS